MLPSLDPFLKIISNSVLEITETAEANKNIYFPLLLKTNIVYTTVQTFQEHFDTTLKEFNYTGYLNLQNH